MPFEYSAHFTNGTSRIVIIENLRGSHPDSESSLLVALAEAEAGGKAVVKIGRAVIADRRIGEEFIDFISREDLVSASGAQN